MSGSCFSIIEIIEKFLSGNIEIQIISNNTRASVSSFIITYSTKTRERMVAIFKHKIHCLT